MTKRCKNCGWPNDDNNTICEKCSAPLDAMPCAKLVSQQTVSESSGENLRKTVSESQFFGSVSAQDGRNDEPQGRNGNSGVPKSNCPNCGYPVREGMSVCPDCGTILHEESNEDGLGGTKRCSNCGKVNDMAAKFCAQCGSSLEHGESMWPVPGVHNHQGTVNPWMQPNNGTFCTLKPIPWSGENVNYQPLSFSGKTIVLNRANTDPNNQSITSTEQAELLFEDDEWYIVDKSTQHTTYVLASRPTKLQKGDIIVLGNRLFEFN